ncbi:GTP-binding protein [Psychromonas sp. MB-3u-54]|uniref:GTPase n=1 Tax=Psychromonas sp. MB-3u-54 TaxID=2058319 RepID=UPI000C31C9C9|nr:GTPase [Psychromonas sp. MB-3u-54]PKH01226.1 GTP-binding protein [Psychromonas sp. MB-3u-54]
MGQHENIFKTMEDDLHNANDLDDATKKKIFENILSLKTQELNIMITGATGCGKSSTINALFNTDVAKVGVGVDPETMDITKYELNSLVLWDSPGLGDGKQKDNQHAKNIINKLNELDGKGNSLIDLVLVILDGSTRDLGTSYELINNVIIPSLGEDASKRILVAINQADVAMKGRNNWDFEENKPTEKLEKFLCDKVVSVKNRVHEATGVKVEPVFYAAGYKEEGENQRPYNLSKLLYFIVKHTPNRKRVLFANDNVSNDDEMWKDNDDIKEYNNEIKESVWESVKEHASEGAEIGADIGTIFGKTGEAVGKVVGGAIGGAIALGKKIFSGIFG